MPVAFSDGIKGFCAGRSGWRYKALGVSDLRLTNVEELYRDEITDIRDFMSDEDDNVYAYTVGIGKPKSRFSTQSMKRQFFYRDFKGAFPEEHGEIIYDSSRDGDLHLVYVTSDRNSGEYYLFDEKEDQSYMCWREGLG